MRSKWVISQTGRKVAKENSSKVAKMAVANNEQDIVVQGSVMIERFRTSPRGAVLGVFTGDRGRRSINGTVVLTTLAKVVKINVEGLIKKNEESKIICGVERSKEAEATSYAEGNQYGAISSV